MQLDRLDALSLLCIEADVLHKIGYEEKSRRKLFNYK